MRWHAQRHGRQGCQFSYRRLPAPQVHHGGVGEELPRRAALLLRTVSALLCAAERDVGVRAGGFGVDVQDADVDVIDGVEGAGEVLGGVFTESLPLDRRTCAAPAAVDRGPPPALML